MGVGGMWCGVFIFRYVRVLFRATQCLAGLQIRVAVIQFCEC